MVLSHWRSQYHKDLMARYFTLTPDVHPQLLESIFSLGYQVLQFLACPIPPQLVPSIKKVEGNAACHGIN
jgi:hypothetical protein